MSTLIEKLNVFRCVLRDKTYSKAEALVLYEIIMMINPERGEIAWPSYAALASETLLSRRTIVYAIKHFLEDGVLIKTTSSKGRRANKYALSEDFVSLLNHKQKSGKTNGADTCTVEVPTVQTRAPLTVQTRAPLNSLYCKANSLTPKIKSAEYIQNGEGTTLTATTSKREATRAGAKQASTEASKSVADKKAFRLALRSRVLTRSELETMSPDIQAALNAELDKLLSFMGTVYNVHQPPDRLADFSRVKGTDGKWKIGKDRGLVWGAYIYCRTEMPFASIHGLATMIYDKSETIEHPGYWIMHRRWMPEDQQPKILRTKFGR